jgi:hypothetical protein
MCDSNCTFILVLHLKKLSFYDDWLMICSFIFRVFLQVEIVLGDEDGLELGESCGQAQMRGRAMMPTCDPGETEEQNPEEGVGWELSGTGSGSLDQSTSSYNGMTKLKTIREVRT